MKTYILRDPDHAELQDPLRSDPGKVALTDTIVGHQGTRRTLPGPIESA